MSSSNFQGVSRVPSLSNFSLKFSRIFKGNNLEDFKNRVNLKEKKRIEKIVQEKERIRLKKMEKLDKISEKYMNIPTIHELCKSEPNIFEKIDMKKKELKQKANQEIIAKEEAKKKIKKGKLIHSTDLVITTNFHRHDSIQRIYSPRDISPSKRNPNLMTTKANKNGISPIRLSRSISHDNYENSHSRISSNINSPILRKLDHKPLHTTIHKKAPILRLAKRETDKKTNSVIETQGEIGIEKINNIKDKITRKANYKLERIKRKNLTNIHSEETLTKNFSTVSKNNPISPEVKVKAFNFDKYSPRKILIPDKIIDVPLSIDITPHPKKETNNTINFDKMPERFKFRKSAKSLTPASPYVGYYNPKFEVVERHHNPVIPFSTKKLKKVPIQKIMSSYEVQLDFKSIKLTESLKTNEY